jgi:putative Ca2+/H+ antiporter (TMEM165/GDT1 family)
MSAESHKPWIVFAGAGTALVATSLIGVWLGCWLAKRVPPKTLETAAGCLLLLVAGQLVWDIIHI